MPDHAFPTTIVPADPLSDAEIQRLSAWAARSTLPAWRSFDPTMPRTPHGTIAELIAEHTAMRAVLDVVAEFTGGLGEVLARLNAKKEPDRG